MNDKEYGLLEVQGNLAREQVREALWLIWRATGLHYPETIAVTDDLFKHRLIEYKRLYEYVGKTLLGDNYWEFEQLT